MKVPESTPYWGLLKELGIWTVRMKVRYQKLMLFKQIIGSSAERTTRKIIIEQRENGTGNGFYWEVKQQGIEIGVDIETAEGRKKSQWKKEIKTGIDEWMDKQLEGKKVTMKKLRHVQGKFSRNVEGYIEKMAVKDVARVMRTRLEMWDIGKNLGGIDRICKGCCIEEEETEHVLACPDVQKRTGLKAEKEWINGNEIELERVTRYIERYLELDCERIHKAEGKVGKKGQEGKEGEANNNQQKQRQKEKKAKKEKQTTKANAEGKEGEASNKQQTQKQKDK